MSSVKIFCLVFCNNIIIMDSTFCKNLKNARKESGLTQKEVANMLCVVESCYANWEQGRTEPNIAMLRRLCNILKISADELIN